MGSLRNGGKLCILIGHHCAVHLFCTSKDIPNMSLWTGHGSGDKEGVTSNLLHGLV